VSVLPTTIERRNFQRAMAQGLLDPFIGMGALLTRRLPGPKASRTFRALEFGVGKMRGRLRAMPRETWWPQP
jgi:hypothetical protein